MFYVTLSGLKSPRFFASLRMTMKKPSHVLCHSERSEESFLRFDWILRFAQDDKWQPSGCQMPAFRMTNGDLVTFRMTILTIFYAVTFHTI